MRVEVVIIQKLAAAIQQNMTTTEAGLVVAPDVFTLILHPETAKHWMDQKLLTVVLHSITEVGQEAGFKFTIPPTITITTDEKIPTNDVEIVASQRIEAMAETNATATPLDTGSLESTVQQIPENAFLIVEGVKIYPLSLIHIYYYIGS